MTLDDAVDHAAGLASQLKGRDAVAVHVLVEAGRRLLKAKRPLRELSQAVSPEGNLNQLDLLGEEKK